MALAVIKPIGWNGDHFRIQVDTGSNRYYQYRIGSKQRRYRGVEMLTEINYQSPIYQTKHPKESLLRSNFLLEIHKDQLNRAANKIQVLSFRDREGKGIAISEPVALMPKLEFSPNDGDLNFSFGQENNKM
ncbi:MAG: hypothetical protein AAFP19_20280, partial [Bacteroidota bacterium]